VALSLMRLRRSSGPPPGVTRHRGSMEPGLSSPRLRKPRPPDPLASRDIGEWRRCCESGVRMAAWGRKRTLATRRDIARPSETTQPSIYGEPNRKWSLFSASSRGVRIGMHTDRGPTFDGSKNGLIPIA
jgi:hypothetical protein